MSEYSPQGNIRLTRILSTPSAVHSWGMAKDKRFLKRPGRRGAYATDEQLETFGTENIKLRQWRIFRDRMTVAELSEEAGVSTGMINDLENANGGAELGTLRKLADALGITVGMLFDVNPFDDEEFWPIYEEADDTQKRIIREQAAILVRRK